LIYKYQTIAHIREKIKEFLNYILFENKTDEENSRHVYEIKDIKLFVALEYKRKLKRSLINLIYNFKLAQKKYRIFGYLIEDDNKNFGVSFNFV